MSENAAFTLAIALKALVACAAIVAGALLAYHEKGESAWFLLLVLAVAPGQIQKRSDNLDK